MKTTISMATKVLGDLLTSHGKKVAAIRETQEILVEDITVEGELSFADVEIKESNDEVLS